ncbi:hypothetical protein F4Z98_04245 [Candidatus Poribacteria bacterium]|nr:hypothetical protein [Candidatus Poribacteria bacterium]MYC39525.1 hypothetical protein [Candidatus Dadabacteria bacterium]
MKKEPSWADDRAFYRSTRHSSLKGEFTARARKVLPAAQRSDSTPKPLMSSGVKQKKTIGVFLSFEFGKDGELHRAFYSEAARYSRYEMIDYSLKKPYSPDLIWLESTKKQIGLSDIIIVMVGRETRNAPGVKKEVIAAHRLEKPIFQVHPRRRTHGKVYGAGEVVPWKWKRIDAKIAEKLLK